MRILFSILVPFLLSTVIVADEINLEIQGVWCQTKGPEDIFSFTKDGEFEAFNLVNDGKLMGFSGKYSVSGNQLTLIIFSSENCKVSESTKETTYFKISKDTLCFLSKKGDVLSSYAKAKDQTVVSRPLSARNFPPKP